MNQENKLDNLNFENIAQDNVNQESDKNEKKESKNFILVFIFSFVILITSVSVLAYYLFLNKDQDKQHSTKEVEKTSIKEISEINLNELLENSLNYQVSIFASDPKKGLIPLGEGVLISNNLVITSGEVISGKLGSSYKTEDLVVKQSNNELRVDVALGDSIWDSKRGFWTLGLVGGFFNGAVTFPNNSFNVGEELNFFASRTENLKGQFESHPVSILQKFKIIGEVDDGFVYITDLKSENYPKVVFDTGGNPVGITYIDDSKNNSTVISGKRINEILASRGSEVKTNKDNNKEKLGIEFEFSELARFRKEGRPVGLVVTEVKDGSISSITGIKKDDIVLTINNQVIVSNEELDNFFENLNPKEELKFEIIREDKKIGITLNLE